MKASQLSDKMLRMISAQDRAPMGKAGITYAEAQVKADVKSERELQNQIENWLRLNSIPAFRQRMDRKSNMPIGTPDFLVCWRGCFYAFEVKVGNNKPTKEQEQCLDAIRAAGGFAFVVRSLMEVKMVIEV